MTMHVDVVSAEELIYSGTAEYMSAPAEAGEIGILPRHAPLLTRIRPGAVRIRIANSDDEDVILFVSGGLLEVQPHVVTVLADTAIRGTDIDEAKAVDAKRRAELRVQAESRLPAHLLYSSGWPTCVPTEEEAQLIAEVRQAVADILGISVGFTTAGEVIARYQELITLRQAKGKGE